MNELFFENVCTDEIHLPEADNRHISVSAVRLDKLHPIISGNKWFKLRYYLEKAKTFSTIATFGGAFSNHLVATAAACKTNNLKSIGIIRGEESKEYSQTLLQAKELGMKFVFVSRTEYSNKEKIIEQFKNENWFWINEGGYGIDGANGAATIHDFIDSTTTHILCAVGTGTTFAGLIKRALPHQTIIGINVLKGTDSIHQEINRLLSDYEQRKKFELLNDFHFGGYAKHPKELIDFMNDFWRRTSIPTDIVYTSKLFYAAEQLIATNYFPEKSKIAIVHSGGLQGNRSLPEGILIF